MNGMEIIVRGIVDETDDEAECIEATLSAIADHDSVDDLLDTVRLAITQVRRRVQEARARM